MMHPTISAIAVVSLIVAGTAIWRSGSSSTDLTLGTAAMPPLQELHTMASVHKLPVQELDDQSFVYSAGKR